MEHLTKFFVLSFGAIIGGLFSDAPIRETIAFCTGAGFALSLNWLETR